jgi:hypothetical protein
MSLICLFKNYCFYCIFNYIYDQVIDVPVTVKLRTGIFDNLPVAHKLIPKFQNWVSMFIIYYYYLLRNYYYI